MLVVEPNNSAWQAGVARLLRRSLGDDEQGHAQTCHRNATSQKQRVKSSNLDRV